MMHGGLALAFDCWVSLQQYTTIRFGSLFQGDFSLLLTIMPSNHLGHTSGSSVTSFTCASNNLLPVAPHLV